MAKKKKKKKKIGRKKHSKWGLIPQHSRRVAKPRKRKKRSHAKHKPAKKVGSHRRKHHHAKKHAKKRKRHSVGATPGMLLRVMRSVKK